jgi:D-aminopeptidase
MESLRSHGLRIGGLEPGPANGIADVPGVGVGHVTIRREEPAPPDGRGVARTGVTAIVPADPATLFREPLAAGMAVLNGAGEMTGGIQVAELGRLETPVYLTATMAVGRVLDGASLAALAADPAVGDEDVVIPVVAECDDSWLNDARAIQVEVADARRALDAAVAGGTVEQGSVGAGTGMVCFGHKGGIGTSSRVAAPLPFTAGVLVLANYGSAEDLRVAGVPFATEGPLAPRANAPGRTPPPRRVSGSCIAVIATDAPLLPAQLERLARRAGAGLARTGGVAHHGSGEIFLAFSTTARAARGAPSVSEVPDTDLDHLFAAVADATEEAVLNALWSAGTVDGRDGRVAHGLPHDEVLRALRAAGRLRPGT